MQAGFPNLPPEPGRIFLVNKQIADAVLHVKRELDLPPTSTGCFRALLHGPCAADPIAKKIYLFSKSINAPPSGDSASVELAGRGVWNWRGRTGDRHPAASNWPGRAGIRSVVLHSCRPHCLHYSGLLNLVNISLSLSPSVILIVIKEKYRQICGRRPAEWNGHQAA